MTDLLYPDGHLWLAVVSGSAIAARVTMVRRTISEKHKSDNKGKICVTLVSKDRPSLKNKTRVTPVLNFISKTAGRADRCAKSRKAQTPLNHSRHWPG